MEKSCLKNFNEVLFMFLNRKITFNNKPLKYNLITILGATAGGKTSFAAHLAHKLGTEIISADSRQVYRGMDIGTGKDLDDYIVDGQQITAHLVDIAEAGYKYNVFEFQHDFFKAFNEISEKGKTPILAGGSGMYIESVLQNYQLINAPINDKLRKELENKTLTELTEILKNMKRLHNTSDFDTAKRAIRAIEIELFCQNNPHIRTNFPKINSLVLGINFDRDSRRRRITERLNERLENGMIQEVQTLLDKGIAPEDLIYYGLEYKFITLYLTNQLTYNQMVENLNTAIHQFAKRQMTWFRGMEKKGTLIHWIDGNEPIEKKIERAFLLLENN